MKCHSEMGIPIGASCVQHMNQSQLGIDFLLVNLLALNSFVQYLPCAIYVPINICCKSCQTP